MTQKTITSEEKIWAAASYLWIISVVALAARKKNEYVRFHANQGVLLFLLSLIFSIIPLTWPLNILVAIAVVVGIVKALQGEQWQMPIIGDTAKKFGDWIIKTLKL